MIITLKGATGSLSFESNRIGVLSKWNITRVIDSGVTYSGPTSVDKGASFSATLTLASGYAYSDGVTVTMGGTDVTASAYTSSTGAISISSVTGNITIKALTYNTSTGESGSTGGGTTGGTGSTTGLVINIEVGTLNAPDGVESTGTSRWRSVDYIETSKIQSTISSTGSRYIICCYDSNKTYLGQVSASDQSASYIKGSGQWQASGTVINKSSITATTTYIRFVFDASNVQILIDGTNCFGQLVANEDSTSSQGVATIYPFETGSLAKESGAEIASSIRWRMSESWTLDKFGSKFTVQECGYAVCCFDASDNYLGQYDVATNQITSGDVLTAAIWNAAASETLVANLTTLGVAKVRIITEGATVGAHLYVDGNIVTA